MEKIEAPKKERKFLKAIGNIGKVLAQELVMGIGRKLIGGIVDKIKLPKKRQGLIILLLLSCGIAFAQYPATGNKQRLGFQTTADGLVWRGSLSDTASIQPTSNQNAWVILDTVNFKFYSFDFTSNVWNQLPSGSTIDTTSLSNRIDLRVRYADTATMLLPYLRKADTSLLNLQSRLNLKLNIADTSQMLSNYATKAYADTSGRFYARQDFTNVSSSTLTWTQSDTLVVGGVTVVQVYRNGQILLPTQYTIPTKTSVVIGSTAYKVGENYTVIFPRGGGAGSGGGSGSLTSISGGTGITVSPNPITTTGTVSADTTFLFTQSDTLSLNLTSRFAAKQNSLTLTTTGTSGASTLVGSTLNIPQYSGGGGSGTVTSVATGYGLSGGTITTTGTLVLDSATVFNRIRDSIVDVAIGNDTIKILKQEYQPATTNILTWTVTSKFPIQLKAYILVFRNGQLLNNDQYNLTDTNKITIVSTSFKSGANYTVATVSGIGSVGSAQGNPIYPEAGIALSTGTTWTTSITNNSTNWNTAYSDRLKWDGGSTGLTAETGRTSLGGTTIGQSMFTLTNPSAITFPRFNADNSVSALTAANFRSAIGAGTVTSVSIASGTPMSITNNTTTPEITMTQASGGANGYLTSTDWTTFNGKQSALTNPVTGTGVSGHIPRFTGTSTLDSSSIYSSNGKIGVGIDASTSSSHLTSKFVVRDNGNNFKFDGSTTSSGYTTTFSHDNTGLKIGHSSDIRDIRFTLNGTSGLTIANNGNSPARAVGIATNSPSYQLDVNGTLGVTGAATLSSTLAVTGATTLSNLAGSGTRMVTASSTGLLSTQSIPTGTVTSVSGSGAISVVNGTTTPVISVADAAFGTAGIVTATGTQQFSGDKTFEGIVQFNARAVFKDYTYTATRLAGLSSTDRLSTVTLGTGLTLSSGVLSATGGVTSVTASTPLSSSGGTTPNITIADASASASGVVNTTTQSFAGNKTFTGTINVSSTGTFGGRVNTPWLERTYTYTTSSTISVGVNTTWLDINTSVLTTLTLPNAATYPGKEIHIRQTGAGSLQSASSNIIPFSVPPTGSTSTGILTASTHRSVTLVSDGTNWIIMQRSDI